MITPTPERLMPLAVVRSGWSQFCYLAKLKTQIVDERRAYGQPIGDLIRLDEEITGRFSNRQSIVRH